MEENKREEIQQEALAAVEGKHRSGLGISMGVGKTYIGLQHMAQEYHHGARLFLVAAPKKSIFQSWIDDAKKFGLEYLLECITFTTYLSLKKQGHVFDVIYLDECHSLLNSHDFYLGMFGGKILGLTGTPPRHQNSEKGKMVQKYCPIVYKYIADKAIDDKILNDYKIVVHKLKLDKRRTMQVPLKNGKGHFMTSEQSSYDYWCDRLNQTFITPKQKQIFRVMRMKAMMDFPSKAEYAKNLLTMMHEKCIVFCNTTAQADAMCDHSYHSKNPDSADNLELFKSGKVEHLSCVLQLNEGINVPDLRAGIILHSYSNERKSSQRIGRLLRLNPDDRATVHILMYEDTVDEHWVASALKDWDSSKIVYTDPII